MKIEDCFYVGYITKTKGLKGEVQIFFEFEDAEALDFPALFLEINGKLVPYFVETFKVPQKGVGYLFLEDIDTIEKAEKLVKKKVYLLNKFKPKKKKGEFTMNDLVGFLLSDEQQGEIGVIAEVKKFPQQFLAAVPYKETEVLIPLNDTFIKAIDTEAKTIAVDLPEGLIDVYLS